MRNFGSVCWGIILIIIGIVLGGNALDIWEIDIFFRGWWTLFIIAPCFLSIIRNGFKFGNTVGLIIGCGLLISAWGFIPWVLLWQLSIPGFFVFIGIIVLFGIGSKKRFTSNNSEGGDSYKYKYEYEYEYDKNNNNASAFCSCGEQRVVNEPYYGGRVSATMGSTILDLRCAIIEQDIKIKADTLMGSIEIFFPPNVRVIVNSSPILGSVDNQTLQAVAINCPTVHINCSAVLGSIELK